MRHKRTLASGGALSDLRRLEIGNFQAAKLDSGPWVNEQLGLEAFQKLMLTSVSPFRKFHLFTWQTLLLCD